MTHIARHDTPKSLLFLNAVQHGLVITLASTLHRIHLIDHHGNSHVTLVVYHVAKRSFIRAKCNSLLPVFSFFLTSQYLHIMALVAYDDVAKVRNLAIVNRIDIAIAALNIYEYIITFELERKRIWQRKWSWVKWIFMVNRYLAVAYSISMILLLSIATEANCRTLLLVPCVIFLLLGLVQGAFSSLRIRALWPNESIFWPVVVFLLYVVPFGTDIWDYFSLKAMSPISLFGCAPQAGTNNTAIVWLVLCNRLCVIIADIIVLRLTWTRTNANRLEMAKLGFSTSLTFLLLRDGTISFCVLLTLNIIQILMSAAPSWSNFSAVNEFVHWPALFPIVISRFLLDLRQFNERVDPDDGASMSLSHIDSDLHLDMSNCTLGDLGEPMNFDKSGSKDLL